MEFFTASCLRRGKVTVDGCYQGENKDGETLHVFQCCAGLHDISLEYQNGQGCRRITRRVMISGTNAILPKEVRFLCDL
jgi:hypothetical protein